MRTESHRIYRKWRAADNRAIKHPSWLSLRVDCWYAFLDTFTRKITDTSCDRNRMLVGKFLLKVNTVQCMNEENETKIYLINCYSNIKYKVILFLIFILNSIWIYLNAETTIVNQKRWINLLNLRSYFPVCYVSESPRIFSF